MPNIKEIRDEIRPYIDRQGKAFPANVVSIEEQQESAQKGSTGIGLNTESFGEMQQEFNRQGCCNDSDDVDTPSQVGGLPFLRRP